MKAEFTAMVQRDGAWWIGWIEGIPGANAQEKTKEELIESLKEAVIDILAVTTVKSSQDRDIMKSGNSWLKKSAKTLALNDRNKKGKTQVL